MYATLYRYLVEYRELSIPGIGNFSVSRNPALMDFPAKRIDPPSFIFNLQFPAQPSTGRFFYWLGQVLGVPDREAVIRFNDFSFDMRRQIMEGSTIEWKGVGILNKGLAGDIRFVQEKALTVYEYPVTAEKVIRDKPEHMVRVGEEQKTSTEMAAMLGREEGVRSLWWAIPLAIALLAVMFIGWHFSEHGVTQSAAGNSSTLKALETPVTYEIIP